MVEPDRSSRLLAPPKGKALINFHRPADGLYAVSCPVFHESKLIGALDSSSMFQYVCDPGEQVFLTLERWHAPVGKLDVAFYGLSPLDMWVIAGPCTSGYVLDHSALFARVLPDQVYDVVLVSKSVAFGTFFLKFLPVSNEGPLRTRVLELEKDEPLVRLSRDINLESRRGPDPVADILRLLAGYGNGSTVKHFRWLHENDHR